MIEVRELSADEGREHLVALTEVLLDCVAGGASVNFMDSLNRAEAEAFFNSVCQGVERGERILLAAFLHSDLVGTVQIYTATPPNQSHRADVAKLLVKRPARRQGVAERLMQYAEEVSWAAGKTLLVLDTAAGDPAEALYVKMGWTTLGTIPRYALYPDGAWCDATFFYKELA